MFSHSDNLLNFFDYLILQCCLKDVFYEVFFELNDIFRKHILMMNLLKDNSFTFITPFLTYSL